MGFLVQLVAFILLPLLVSTRAEDIINSSKPCDFPAIFNFGDSNSDTGCMAAAFYPEVSPYGETFFHEPVGRASDGRLITDFIGSIFKTICFRFQLNFVCFHRESFGRYILHYTVSLLLAQKVFLNGIRDLLLNNHPGTSDNMLYNYVFICSNNKFDYFVSYYYHCYT